MTPGRHSERGYWQVVAVVGIILLATILRFYGLDRTSVWLDESFTWHQASMPFIEMYRATVNDVHPPLYNLLAWTWIRLFGDGEAAMRSLSAVLGTLGVYALYLTGSLAWNRKTGLVATLILAVSGFHIWYSQEFRAYSLLTLTSILFLLSVYRLAIRPGPREYGFNLVAAVLLLYSHVFGAFLFAGVNIYLALACLRRADWVVFDGRKWLLGQIGAGLMFSPWALILVMQTDSNLIAWVPELGLYQFFSQLALLFNGPFTAVIACSIALFSVWFIYLRPATGSVGATSSQDDRWEDDLLLVWLVSPIAITMAISLLGKPLFMSRYLIFCLPAMCLLVTRGLFQLARYRVLQMAAVLLLSLGLAHSTWYAHHLEKEQYRQVIRDIRSCHEEGEPVVLMPGFTIVNLRYYWRDPELQTRKVHARSDLPDILAKTERAWLIHWAAGSGPALLPSKLLPDSHQVAWSRRAWRVDAYLLTARSADIPGSGLEGGEGGGCIPAALEN